MAAASTTTSASTTAEQCHLADEAKPEAEKSVRPTHTREVKQQGEELETGELKAEQTRKNVAELGELRKAERVSSVSSACRLCVRACVPPCACVHACRLCLTTCCTAAVMS